jgi:hypothetical protein
MSDEVPGLTEGQARTLLAAESLAKMQKTNRIAMLWRVPWGAGVDVSLAARYAVFPAACATISAGVLLGGLAMLLSAALDRIEVKK